MSRSEDPKSEVESEDAPSPASRTRQKQEARAVMQLGLELIALPPAELEALKLAPELVEAILLCRRLRLRAQSRQKRLIAQFLRAEDHEAIRRQLQTHRVDGLEDGARNPEDELWCARLIAEGDEALQDFMEAYPDADRQQLRTWIRSASQDSSGSKAQRARRSLLSLIASVRTWER